MNAQLVKPKTILNGSLLIALYFTFWIVVTVVLDIQLPFIQRHIKSSGRTTIALANPTSTAKM